ELSHPRPGTRCRRHAHPGH
ncbi:MAG: hypothetical protein AVDCRST_MAG48-1761, partial [uncultured Friedmanniella sp.]